MRTIIDSGTNIHVASLQVMEELRRLGVLTIVHTAASGLDLGTVRFGKRGAVARILFIIQGGGCIETVAVVEDIDVCLTSVAWFTRHRDMQVTFSKDTVDFTYKGALVIRGEYDDGLGMCTLDMVELILAPNPCLAGSKEAMALTARKHTRFSQQAISKALQLHKNLGCLPFSTMASQIAVGAWNVDADITEALLRELERRKLCVICGLTRWRQETHEGSGVPLAIAEAEVGKYIFTDDVGKITPCSASGKHYYQVVGDAATKMHRNYGMVHKSEAIEAIGKWIVFSLQHGHVPMYILSDAGSNEVSELAQEAYARWGIVSIPTPAKVPAGIVERVVQTTMDDIKALLMTNKFFSAANWLECAEHSAQLRSYCINNSSARIDATKTPFELFTRQKPPMDRFMEMGLGDFVVVQTPAKERKMGQPRNQLGQVHAIKDDGSKGVMLRIPGKKRVLSARARDGTEACARPNVSSTRTQIRKQ